MVNELLSSQLPPDKNFNVNFQTPEQWFSNLGMHQDHLEVLLGPRLLGLTPRGCASLSLGWGLRICISVKVSGAAAAAVPGITLAEPLP